MEILPARTERKIDSCPIQRVLDAHNPSDIHLPRLVRWKNEILLGNTN